MRTLLVLLLATISSRAAVEFNRDVRPLLSDNCFGCHGPDAATKNIPFRLDIEERAKADLGNGRRAIVPGDPAKSALLARMELARAFLYAHHVPSSLTKARLATLAPLFDVLLEQREPLASHDVRAVLTYVLRTFPEGSPVRAMSKTRTE